MKLFGKPPLNIHNTINFAEDENQDVYRKTLAIDFDGVIHKFGDRAYQNQSLYQNEVPGAINAIATLFFLGYNVIIFTARDQSEHPTIKKWICNKLIDTFGDDDRLQEIFDNLTVTNIKPKAVMYIDDRGVRFTNWDDMMSYFC